MPGVVENFKFGGESAQPSWAAEAAAEAYSKAHSIADFGKKNWQEIAGVGVVLGAGAVLIASGLRLGAFGEFLKGGESVAATTERLAEGSGTAQGLLDRLRGVDHFVFDMDRTLVDHDKSLAVLKQTMTDGLVAHTGLSNEFITDALAQTAKRLDSPYFWNRLDEIRPLQAQFPGVDLNERFAAVSKSAKAAYYDALKAKPETVDLLKYLRSQGKSVHVFTAGSPARALEKLQGAGLLDHIDNIYTSGINAFEDTPTSGMLTRETTSSRVIPLAKSAKEFGSGYQTILDHLSTNADRVAMTGDHPIEDVAHAKELGIFTSQAKWYRSVPAENVLPDLELTSPSQLTDILKVARKAQAA